MKASFIVAGIVSGGIGLNIWINKGGSLYRQSISQYTGIVLIIFSLFLLGAGFFGSRKKREKYICPNCENIV